MVDLYYALYGNRRPLSLPTPELSAMFKPQKVSSGSTSTYLSSSVAEVKSRPESPLDIKPLDIVDNVDVVVDNEPMYIGPMKMEDEEEYTHGQKAENITEVQDELSPQVNVDLDEVKIIKVSVLLL